MSNSTEKELIVLSQNKEFKNYRELCGALNWKVSSGEAKINQLKRLDTLCVYAKSGNKFIIESTLEPVEKAKIKKSRVDYMDNLELVIIGHLLQEGSRGECCIGKNALMETVGMINGNYSQSKKHQFKLAKLLDIDIRKVNDYFSLNNRTIKDDLESALKRLQNRKLIQYNTTVIIRKTEVITNSNSFVYTDYTDEFGIEHEGVKVNSFATKTYLKASLKDRKTILRAEKIVLSSFGYKTIQSVYMFGKTKEYYKAMYREVRKDIPNFDMCFGAYDIVFDESFLINYLEEIGFENWSEEELTSNRNIVNTGVKNKIINNSNKRCLKSKSELSKGILPNKFYRAEDDYVISSETLNKNVIDTESQDIVKRVKETIISKEEHVKMMQLTR